MTNPKGIAGKTFSTAYSIHRSRRSRGSNGNAQSINIVLILVVFVKIITEKLNSREETPCRRHWTARQASGTIPTHV